MTTPTSVLTSGLQSSTTTVTPHTSAINNMFIIDDSATSASDITTNSTVSTDNTTSTTNVAIQHNTTSGTTLTSSSTEGTTLTDQQSTLNAVSAGGNSTLSSEVQSIHHSQASMSETGASSALQQPSGPATHNSTHLPQSLTASMSQATIIQPINTSVSSNVSVTQLLNVATSTAIGLSVAMHYDTTSVPMAEVTTQQQGSPSVTSPNASTSAQVKESTDQAIASQTSDVLPIDLSTSQNSIDKIPCPLVTPPGDNPTAPSSSESETLVTCHFIPKWFDQTLINEYLRN